MGSISSATRVMKRQIGFLLVLLIGMSCGSGQIRVEFDSAEKSFRTCYEYQIIRNIVIWEQGSSDFGYRFYLDENAKGSSIIYVEKENAGYRTSDENLFKFMPNKKYVLSTTYLDSHAEIILFTNQYAEVDSVINNFACVK